MFNSLKERLLEDIHNLGLDIDDDTLVLKEYSKSYYGCYRVKSDRIYLYIFADPNRKKMYPYRSLLFTLIHEVIHREQWKDPNYVRVKGVMHDSEFYHKYDYYTNIAGSKLIIRGLSVNEKKQRVSATS